MTTATLARSEPRHVRVVRRSWGAQVTGVLVLLIGAWIAIVPYLAPFLRFSGDGTPSWTWSFAHSMLFLVPGAVAVFAGLVIFAGGQGAWRDLLKLGGTLAVLCGAWVVVGPVAWHAMEGSSFFVAAAPMRELAYWISYSLGPGGLLLVLGAFAIGKASPFAAL